MVGRMTGQRRLSQAISEGDGISLIVPAADADAARRAEAQGAEGVVVDGSVPGVREATGLADPLARAGLAGRGAHSGSRCLSGRRRGDRRRWPAGRAQLRRGTRPRARLCRRGARPRGARAGARATRPGDLPAFAAGRRWQRRRSNTCSTCSRTFRPEARDRRRRGYEPGGDRGARARWCGRRHRRRPEHRWPGSCAPPEV